MWQPDPVSLRLFIAVCEEGSIARASEREGMAAAAVSKRVADMERGLGTQLLIRSSRGVNPTPAGDILLRHAKHLMQGVEQMQSDLSEFSSGVRGLVRVLANISSIVEFVPEEIASFLQTHENIHVVLEERASSEIVRGIAEGSADIGICRDFVAEREVEMLPFRADHFCVVVHRSHPLADRSEVSFADTLGYEHVGFAPNVALHALTRRVAYENRRTIRYRANVTTFDAACRLVHLNLGLAVLPAEAIQKYQPLYNICAIKLIDPWATRQFVICVRHADQLSSAASKFLAHLTRTLPPGNSTQ